MTRRTTTDSTKSYVTLVQHICPVCGIKFDTGELLLDRRLKDTFEHHTVTGMSMCAQCQKLSDDGYVALVVCDPTKSVITERADKSHNCKPGDAHRTGEIAHVRRTAFNKIFDVPIADNVPLVFIEPAVFTMLQTLTPETEQVSKDDDGPV